MKSLDKIFNPISNDKVLIGIIYSIIAIIPIMLLINNYAYKNGKLVCNDYVLNSYLYTLLGFCFIALGSIFEQKTKIIFNILVIDNIILKIIILIAITLIFTTLSNFIKNTDPNNFIPIHIAFFFACAIFGMILSFTLVLGSIFGVLNISIIITIILTTIMGFIGYKYGNKFITINFDKYLKYALFTLIIWVLIARFLIKNPITLLFAISIPSAIIFCLLLMSYNNQLRKNQEICKVPNYPKEALGLVIKIGNLLGDVIRILIASKSKNNKIIKI